MDIYILTYGRATEKQQHTLRQLRAEGVPVTLVVQEREAEKYGELFAKEVNMHVLPDHILTISATRDYLLHDCNISDDPLVCMLDDDLEFCVRRRDDTSKFRKAQPGEVRELFKEIELTLKSGYPMVGVCPREGGNRPMEDMSTCTRIIRVLAFDRRVVRKLGVRCAPTVFMQDFHLNLQLLRAGYDTAVLNLWAHGHVGGSDSAGGCSSYRTNEAHTKAAELLAGLHAGLVKVVDKTTKTSWNGQPRKDVVVQWKQARKSAR